MFKSLILHQSPSYIFQKKGDRYSQLLRNWHLILEIGTPTATRVACIA